MIRVAIADDSAFTCALLAAYIEEDGECEVVGVAHDAAAAVDIVRRTRPDVLTLDLQMPGCDGLDLLARLTAESPVSVVVISGVTKLAAATTLRALELGAVDFVLKYTPGAPVSRASLKREILAKVRTAATAQAVCAGRAPAAAEPVARPAARIATPTTAGRVVVIGASTGGPRAVGEVLAQLPADFAAPCIVVQHLPATFTAPFAAQLERRTKLRVREASPGDVLAPGTVLLAPGSVHLLVTPEARIELRPPAPADVYRPSIDLTMTSAAAAYGPAATGVLLTGMGSDGVEGLLRIRASGGETFAQTPASCVVASMPQRAIDRGAPLHVGAPARIGQMLAVRAPS